MALTIISHPEETMSQEGGTRAYTLAVTYTAAEFIAHGVLIVYGPELLAGLLGSESESVTINSKGEPYPNVIDPRTGEPIHPPPSDLQWVPPEERVPWGRSERSDYIQEWYELGYDTPAGGWENYDIHHIQPREYGGTNDFENLVPILRDTHQRELNPWWYHYPRQE
jgi:hypothetical protein